MIRIGDRIGLRGDSLFGNTVVYHVLEYAGNNTAYLTSTRRFYKGTTPNNDTDYVFHPVPKRLDVSRAAFSRVERSFFRVQYEIENCIEVLAANTVGKVRIGQRVGIDGASGNHGCTNYCIVRCCYPGVFYVAEAQSCHNCWQVGHDSDYTFTSPGDIWYIDDVAISENDFMVWDASVEWVLDWGRYILGEDDGQNNQERTNGQEARGKDCARGTSQEAAVDLI